jgi:hypothetical protein
VEPPNASMALSSIPEISIRTSGAPLASERDAGSLSDVPAGIRGVPGTADAAFASSSEENSGFIKFLQVNVTTLIAYHWTTRLGEPHLVIRRHDTSLVNK